MLALLCSMYYVLCTALAEVRGGSGAAARLAIVIAISSLSPWPILFESTQQTAQVAQMGWMDKLAVGHR